MLVTINDKKNIETGILQVRDQYKKQLANYRNTLLENMTNNFTKTVTYQTREDSACDISRKKTIYPQGDFLIKEEYVELLANHIPFETYVYLVKKTQIECKSLLTPEKSCDLNSFRNSLYFLEYHVFNEYSWQELATSPLNTPINQVAANTEVLFGGPVKVLKKNR